MLFFQGNADAVALAYSTSYARSDSNLSFAVAPAPPARFQKPAEAYKSRIELEKEEQKNHREVMFAQLEKDKAEWAARREKTGGGHTQADNIGHLGEGASKHNDMTFTDAETAARSKRNSRKETAAKLEAERKTFEARRDAGTLGTAPEELGHFAQETAATKNSYDKDKSTKPDSEEVIDMRRHGRERMSQEGLHSKEAWEKRRNKGALATKVESGDAHYLSPTKTSTAKGDMNSEVPAKEAIQNGGRTRKALAQKTAADKAAWEKRREARGTNTAPDDLGHFAEPTRAANKRKAELREHRKEVKADKDFLITEKKSWFSRQSKKKAALAAGGGDELSSPPRKKDKKADKAAAKKPPKAKKGAAKAAPRDKPLALTVDDEAEAKARQMLELAAAEEARAAEKAKAAAEAGSGGSSGAAGAETSYWAERQAEAKKERLEALEEEAAAGGSGVDKDGAAGPTGAMMAYRADGSLLEAEGAGIIGSPEAAVGGGPSVGTTF